VHHSATVDVQSANHFGHQIKTADTKFTNTASIVVSASDCWQPPPEAEARLPNMIVVRNPVFDFVFQLLIGKFWVEGAT
jgi:hypothetical protein